MMYGLEKDLEVADLKMLRFSLGVNWMDKIRSTGGTARVELFGDKVGEVRLRWFGRAEN